MTQFSGKGIDRLPARGAKGRTLLLADGVQGECCSGADQCGQNVVQYGLGLGKMPAKILEVIEFLSFPKSDVLTQPDGVCVQVKYRVAYEPVHGGSFKGGGVHP